MRVLIASDVEGAAGIANGGQVTGGRSPSEAGRKLCAEEVAAAVRGACAAGATAIAATGCHGAGEGWSCDSRLPDRPDPGCEFALQHEGTE
jgi:D-amino peptidase